MDQDQSPERTGSGGDKTDAEKESLASSSIGEDPASSRDSGDAKESNSSEASNTGTLRKGKWTVEEEDYTSRIIHYFNNGLLTLPEGATLRSYLAEKLNCDPMRVTKKYAGASCLGRRVYHFHNRPQPTVAQIQLARAELDLLEQRFRQRVEEGRSGIPNPSTSLIMNPFGFPSAQALPNPMAGSAAALQAILVNMAAAAANSPPAAPPPLINISPSSVLLGSNQQAVQTPLAQPNVLAANALLEALAKQSQQQPNLESTVMNLAVAQAAASLSAQAPSPAVQQLNILNQLLAKNQLILGGLSTSAPPTQPPSQQVASTLPTLHVSAQAPAGASLSVNASGPPSATSTASTVNKESYAEQLKRTFEAHLRANNIPIPHLAANSSASSHEIAVRHHTGQAPTLPALVPSLPQASSPPQELQNGRRSVIPAAPAPAQPFNGDGQKAVGTKKPPPSLKSLKSPIAGNAPIVQKVKTLKEGKSHSKYLQAKAPRFVAKHTPVRSVHAGSASDLNGIKPRTEEEKAAGTILIGFLSSLRDSYEDAVRARGEATRQEESDEFTYDPRTGAASKAATVTDWSSTQQPESSIDDSDWNSDKKTDPSSSEDSDKEEKEGRRNSGSQGPPRKRLKRIAMESSSSGNDQDRD